MSKTFGVPDESTGNWLTPGGWSQIVEVDTTQKIDAALSRWANEVPENTIEIFPFGLTLAEKQSIEDDINAGKPIMATPAYTKFLSVLLPNGFKVEDENEELKFSRDIPEYEIYNGAICVNHVGAVAIISEWLSELFGRSVRLPTSTEIQDKITEHSHYTGYRFVEDNDESWHVDDIGGGWVVDGYIDSEYAPYAWLHRGGYDIEGSGRINRRSRLSLFPYFG